MDRRCWAGVVVGMQVAGVAAAQTQAEDAVALDKVVVTATRTGQTLMDAPVAATVMTEAQLRDARVQSLRDIDDYVPNVQFNQIGQVGGTYITIRGIESNPFIVNRAAVYIDGIPFRQPADQALGFAEQVEVLRGPQGTLYGANTESGLIVVRTRQPSDTLEGEASLSAEHFGNGEGYSGRFSLAGPLVQDVLTGSLVATRDQADSYVRNNASSIGEPGSLEQNFIQGKLRWTPGDHTRVDFVGYASLLTAPGLYEQEFLPIDRSRYDANYAAYNGGRSIGRFELLQDAPKRTEEDEYVAGANLNHAFEAAVLDVSTSWRQVKETSFGTDLDMTAMPAAAGGHRDSNRYWTFETRLAADTSSPLQWVVGYSHYRESTEKSLSTLMGASTLTDYGWAPAQQSNGRDHALFGNLTVPLGAQWRLSAGARYERAHREKNQQAGVLDLGALGSFQYTDENLQADFSDVLPRVSLDWKPSDNVLVYASAAKGWIPGGFNLAATALSVERDYSRYDAESLWTYELGGKWSLLDGQLALGAAVFHTRASQWQDYTILYDANGQIASTTMVTTDASIRSRGFEVEATWRPSAQLDVVASFGRVDSEYTRYDYGLQDLTGQPVKLVPEWDASLATSWRPWRGLFLRAELNGVGDTPLHVENIAIQRAYWLTNLAVGWEAPRWSARAYVDNLADKRVLTTSAYNNSLFGYDGTYYAGVGAPRVVGVRMDWRW